MASSIRNPKTRQVAKAVSELTDETKTQAVTVAPQERLERIQRERFGESLADELDEIPQRCASLPAHDNESEDEILGYNKDGLSR